MAGVVDRAARFDHRDEPVGVVVEHVEGALRHLGDGGHVLGEGHDVGIGVCVSAALLLQRLAAGLSQAEDASRRPSVLELLEVVAGLDEGPGRLAGIEHAVVISVGGVAAGEGVELPHAEVLSRLLRGVVAVQFSVRRTTLPEAYRDCRWHRSRGCRRP